MSEVLRRREWFRVEDLHGETYVPVSKKTFPSVTEANKFRSKIRGAKRPIVIDITNQVCYHGNLLDEDCDQCGQIRKMNSKVVH